jgi:hypothetical protein
MFLLHNFKSTNRVLVAQFHVEIVLPKHDFHFLSKLRFGDTISKWNSKKKISSSAATYPKIVDSRHNFNIRIVFPKHIFKMRIFY